MKIVALHLLYRIGAIAVALFLGALVCIGELKRLKANRVSDPDPHAGMFDGWVILIVMPIVILLCLLFLGIDTYRLHNLGLHTLRNWNLGIFAFGVLFLLLVAAVVR